MTERLDTLRRELDVLAQWTRDPPRAAHAAATAAPLLWEELKTLGLWQTLPGRDQAAVYRTLAQGRRAGRELGSTQQADHWMPQIAELRSEIAYLASRCEPDSSRWPEATPDRAAQSTAAATVYGQFTSLPLLSRTAVLAWMQPPRGQGFTAPEPARPTLADAVADAVNKVAHREPLFEPPRRPYAEIEGRILLDYLGALPREWRVEVFRRIAVGITARTALHDADRDINEMSGYGVRLAWNVPVPPR
ncbi:hypothetical protein OG275_38275 (plasmid) [Streptomyces niveus]|uniref:hypothetical protein n=1 Tax=Streptomyces niveus TaxID=193462 RepID=UPI002E2EADC4|nr:hypothetical protein [Streptomyces niveus]